VVCFQVLKKKVTELKPDDSSSHNGANGDYTEAHKKDQVGFWDQLRLETTGSSRV
jgi:hypothetical protein